MSLIFNSAKDFEQKSSFSNLTSCLLVFRNSSKIFLLNFFKSYLPHPKLSHNENWSFGDLVLANCLQQRFAIASQYFLVLVQNTTLNGDKNQKKPIVTPGGAECGI
jgi:hypothetical protein